MNTLSRVLTGLTEVTSRDVAQRQAIKRLNPNPHDLIRDIEADIKRQGGDLHVSVRGGEYTPGAVAQVAELYRGMGWRVETGRYWMTLS